MISSPIADASKILFISDVHLGAFSAEKNRALENKLIHLIDFAQLQNYRIVILGDLFDYWIEYPHFIPSLGRRVLDRFQLFHRQTTSSLYITGNHDAWTLGHFARRGFDVEPTCRMLTIQNMNVLLLHGDATGPHVDNLQRPLGHRIIRNKTFLKLYRVLPPKVGLQIMKIFSALNRRFDKNPAPGQLDTWARMMLKKKDLDLILCGHDHVARTLKFDYGTYINLGNFYDDQTLVAYNKDHFLSVKWNEDQQKLVPL